MQLAQPEPLGRAHPLALEHRIEGGGATGRRLRTEIKHRDEQRREIKAQLKEQRRLEADAEAAVLDAEAASARAEDELDALERAALAQLKQNDSIRALFDTHARHIDVLDGARKKTQRAEEDAAAKSPAFENDPLFAYLLSRNFGQDAYQGSGLTAVLDSWVARLVRFNKHFPDYQRLRAIPKRMQEHQGTLEAEADRLDAEVAKLRAEAIDAWPGVKEARRTLDDAHTALERAKGRLNTIATRADSLDNALTSFAEGRDPHTQQALQMVSSLLLRGSNSEARTLVGATDTDEDDKALATLQQLRDEIESRRKEVAVLKERQTAARQQYDRIHSFVQRFGSSNLARRNRRYSGDINGWVSALVAAKALDSLYSQVSSNARVIDDTPAYQSSSSSSIGSFGGFGGSSGGFGTGGGIGGGGFRTGGGV